MPTSFPGLQVYCYDNLYLKTFFSWEITLFSINCWIDLHWSNNISHFLFCWLTVFPQVFPVDDLIKKSHQNPTLTVKSIRQTSVGFHTGMATCSDLDGWSVVVKSCWVAGLCAEWVICYELIWAELRPGNIYSLGVVWWPLVFVFSVMFALPVKGPKGLIVPQLAFNLICILSFETSKYLL